MLMAGDTAPADSAKLGDQLRAEGFTQVTVLSGTPPALDQVDGSAAAA
jgi:hypothetical protein